MPVRSALLIEVLGSRRRAWSCGSGLLLLLLLLLLWMLLLLLLRLLSAISTLLRVPTVPRVASRTVSVKSSVLLLHLLLVEMGVLHLLHLIVLHLLLLLHGPGLPMPRKAPASTSAHVSPRTILHYVGDDLNANSNLFISLGGYYDFSRHTSGHILVNLDPAA